jgi:hypothetical protein
MYPNKVKASRVAGPIVEVDRHGDPVAVVAAPAPAPAKAPRRKKAAA